MGVLVAAVGVVVALLVPDGCHIGAMVGGQCIWPDPHTGLRWGIAIVAIIAGAIIALVGTAGSTP